MQDCSTGAILDHSTDSAGVIEDAITNAPPGGRIFIKAGTYTFTTINAGTVGAIGTVTASIYNIELYGEGNATDLVAGTNLNSNMIVVDAGGWYIHDLQIDGNRAAQSASGNGAPFMDGISGGGIYYDNNLVVQHCYIHDVKDFGIGVYGNSVKILDNYITNTNANGIQINGIAGGASDYLVEGNSIVGFSDVGISVSGSSPNPAISGALVTDNYVYNGLLGLSPFSVNSGDGIYVGDNGAASNITVSGNQIYNVKGGIVSSPGGSGTIYNTNIALLGNQIHETTSNGMYAQKTTKLSIVDNVLDSVDTSGGGTGQSGINLSNSGVTGAEVVGNTLFSVGTTTNNHGIYVNGPSGTIVEDNFINVTSGNGINVYTPSNNNTITGNHIEETGGAGIAVYASNGNIITSNGVDNPASGKNGITLFNSFGNFIIGNNVSRVTGTGIILSSGCQHNTVQGNDVRGDTTAFADSGSLNVVSGNIGYNPKGHIASPWISTGSLLGDTGGSSTPTNQTTYTVNDSPKLLLVVIGSGWTSAHTLVIQVDGTQVISTNAPAGNTVYTFNLNPGQTFCIQYQAALATFVVSGE